MALGLGGGGCSPTELIKRVEGAAKEFIKFVKSGKQKDITTMGDADTIIEDVFYQVFRRQIHYIDTLSPPHHKVKEFENHLRGLQRNIRNGTFENGFMNWMYNTSSRVKKFPFMAKLYEDLGRAEHTYKARQLDHNRRFDTIIKSIKQHANQKGFEAEGFSLKKAVKESDRLENEVERAARDVWAAKNGKDNRMDAMEAQARLDDALTMEKDFYSKGEGKIFNDILKLIEGGTKIVEGKEVPLGLKGAAKLMEEGYLVEYRNKREKFLAAFKKGKHHYTESEIKDKLANDPELKRLVKDLDHVIEGLTPDPHMQKLLKDYVMLMEDMHHILNQGVGSTISAMKTQIKDYSIGESVNPKTGKKLIDEIETKLKEKLMPDKIEGYYPQYRRVLLIDYLDGLMPKIQAIQDKLGDSLRMDKKGANKALEDLHSYVNAHAGRRVETKFEDMDSGALYQEYSKNFIGNIKRYINEIDRYNYIANVDKFSRDTLSEIKSIFRSGRETEGVASDAVKMIYEINQAAKGGQGTRFENESLEKFSQMALGLEFVSKIGLNPRSAGFNATQYLLNMVEYGPTMIKKSGDFYKTETIKIGDKQRRMDEVVNELLYDSGLLFTEGSPELQEITGIGAAGKISKFKVHGKEIDFVEPSWIDKAHGISGKVMGKAGWMMGYVENKLRKSTFKLGFYKHWQTLMSDSTYRDALRAEGLSSAQITRRFISESRNAAINAVGLLHFNYSAKSKAKWLRDPRFRFLGQFQHYAMKMIEYNVDVAKGAKNDYIEGKLVGDGAMRAYRMGMVYFLMPAIASAVTGIEWGNMVENATATRLQQMYTLFTGEDEEIKKAFYGRGPLLGSLGAPLFSDLIKMGQIMEWYDMDEDSKIALITGFTDYGDATGDEKAYEMARILSTSLSRQYYQNFPLIADGKLGSALQFEFGLYPTKTAKEKKKKLSELAPGVEDALAQAIEYAKKGKYHR